VAEETDSHSRTEEPTPKRLEDARKKGDVAKTADLPSWASLAAVISILTLMGGSMARDLLIALLPFIAHPDAFQLEGAGAEAVMRMALTAALPLIVIVMLAAAAAGVAGNLVQSGFLWTADKLKPDFKKVSPQEGFKRIYGPDGLMQFVKSLLKVLLLAVVCWVALKPHAAAMIGILRAEPAAILPFAAGILKAVAFSVLGVLALGAAADWFWQRHRFMKRMRMSREELKEEMKQSDGDPHIKARQRQIRMERARRRMMQNVPKATVIITNPTHFAVALRYVAGETAVPECVAKGVDKVALKIREVAADAGVPIIEDPPLARALYATVDVDQVIPQQHFEAVAKIIGFVLGAAKRRRIGLGVS
jgi:flagellar biosynthesis protein FlhB